MYLILVVLVLWWRVKTILWYDQHVGIVSNSAFVACCWTVTWYVALMPSTESSLIIMASSVGSQFELGGIKLEYQSKRLNRSSLSAASCNDSPLSMWLSCVEVMISHNLVYCNFLWLGNIRLGVWLLQSIPIHFVLWRAMAQQPNICKIAGSSLYSWITMYIIIKEIRCHPLMLNSPATRWHWGFHLFLNSAILHSCILATAVYIIWKLHLILDIHQLFLFDCVGLHLLVCI